MRNNTYAIERMAKQCLIVQSEHSFRLCPQYLTVSTKPPRKDQIRQKKRAKRRQRKNRGHKKREGWGLNASWPLHMSTIPCWQAEDHFQPSTRGLLLPSSLQKPHTHTHTHTQITERSLTEDSPIWGRK